MLRDYVLGVQLCRTPFHLSVFDSNCGEELRSIARILIYNRIVLLNIVLTIYLIIND